MADDLYVITGATGNIGRRAALALLEGGRRVRAVGRSEERLAPLVEKGAEAAAGSLEDGEFLAEAFRGARAVFTMVPPNLTAPDFRLYQRRIVDGLVAGIERAGVGRAVNLSSIGAHLPSGTGPIAGLHEAEQRLDAVDGLEVVHLRPAFFMENLLTGIDTIKRAGINGGMVAPDVSLPMIATKDVAAAAAESLPGAAAAPGSSVKHLLGPRNYTMVEATRILGEAIGRPELPYVQFPYEQARQSLVEAGLSESVADSYVEMSKAMNDGTIWSAVARTPETSTPTTLEEFAPVFARAFAS